MTITFDKTFNTNGMATTDKIVDAMRLYIMNLGTASKDHLTTPTTGFLYSAKAEDLIMVLDTNFFVGLSREASTLFNKEEVLLKPKKFFWNFNEYLPANRKGKVVGYILDKKALRNGIQYRMDGVIKLPKFRILMEEAYKHTLLRVKKLAIAKFEDTGSGRAKREAPFPKQETVIPKMETPTTPRKQTVSKTDSTSDPLAP